MKNTGSKGTTLVEIMIAALVFSLALGALLNSLTSIVDIIDISRDKTQAVVDTRNMMERVRATPFDTLTTRFPNGTVNGPLANPYQAIVGGAYALRGENITVTYINLTSDPLELTVRLGWLSKKGTPFHMAASTFRTR